LHRPSCSKRAISLEKTAVSRLEHVDRRCLADIAALKDGAETVIGVGIAQRRERKLNRHLCSFRCELSGLSLIAISHRIILGKQASTE
jgi:hypothetical protein